MRIGGVINLLGKLLFAISLLLLTPIPASLVFGDGMSMAFILSSAIGMFTGLLLIAPFRPASELSAKDGFMIVVLSWIAISLLGALPFRLSGAMPSFVDAFFESMSGFTTTGSSILADVDAIPASINFWRAMTHWLGGMGIIVLGLAILPLLNIGGMQLFQAEVAGPTKDKLAPRIQDTARILWGVYLLLTLFETLLLMLGGLSFFDALCHSFATLATGGFSTHTASIAHFTSVIATINGAGPGLAKVGPAQNFGHLSDTAKLILCGSMLAGRLEFFTIAVLLTPEFWKMARGPEWRWHRRGALQA